jgi:SagB-type dehydrogenase family enzyme
MAPKKASWSSLHWENAPMSAKEELQQLVDILSDYECSHILDTVRDVAAGERFWEGDVGIFYNEHVKARYFNMARNLASIIPAAPADEEGLFIPIPIVKSYSQAPRVELPQLEPLERSVSSALLERRSRRAYTGEGLTLVQLSTLLHHACGVTGFVQGYDYTRLPLRSFPSSGGLQSTEVYLSIHAVDAVEPGLYHYYPVNHVLELVAAGDHRARLSSIALSQPYVESASVVLVLTGVYERLHWKYGERAYRYMCMDSGFLAENVYVAAEAMGLGTCAIAGFVDDALEHLLAIDGKSEIALLLMTVGIRAEGKASG